MKRCCYERKRRGPMNRLAETGEVCPLCLMAYWADDAKLLLQENKPVKAFERVQNIQKIVRQLHNET